MLEPMILTPEAGVAYITEAVKRSERKPVYICMRTREGNTSQKNRDFRSNCMRALDEAGFTGCRVVAGKENSEFVDRRGIDYVLIEDFFMPAIPKDIGGTFAEQGAGLQVAINAGFNDLEVLRNAGYNLAIENPK